MGQNTQFYFTNLEEIELFYTRYLDISRCYKLEPSEALDIIIDECFNKNIELGFKFLEIIINEGNTIGYVPFRFLTRILINQSSIDIFWNLIQENKFSRKLGWILQFFYTMDSSFFSQKYLELLLLLIKDSKEHLHINLNNLLKFLPTHPNLLNKIVEAAFNKNLENSKDCCVSLDLTNIEITHLLDDIELLKKTYCQQYLLQRASIFDYDKKLFIMILKLDPNFLVQFVENIIKAQAILDKNYNNDKSLSFVWEIDSIDTQLEEIINLFSNTNNYFSVSGSHYCTTFFKNLDNSHVSLANKFLLGYTETYYLDSNKINLIIM
jgi:hypothetical protein